MPFILYDEHRQSRQSRQTAPHDDESRRLARRLYPNTLATVSRTEDRAWRVTIQSSMWDP
jgi:hypothetical protein